jgi:hypothetical protein
VWCDGVDRFAAASIQLCRLRAAGKYLIPLVASFFLYAGDHLLRELGCAATGETTSPQCSDQTPIQPPVATRDVYPETTRPTARGTYVQIRKPSHKYVRADK